MKKFIAILSSVLLLFAFSANVMAAVSPSAKASVSSVEVTLADGTKQTLTKEELASMISITKVDSKVSDQLKTDADLAKIDSSLAGKKLAQLFEVSVKDLEFKSITLTFQVEGVKAGDKVTVIHYVDGAWELITPDSVKDNQVTATFTSLSPVGIVVEASSSAGTTEKSPKTGVDAGMLTIEAMIVVFAGVALYAGKKSRSR